MANMPSAEVDIDIALVARLLASQFPELTSLPLHSTTGGWDNAVIRLGPHLAVRLPRRAAAVPLAEHEHRWLPAIALRISTPIPAPVHIGRRSELFPWPWSVVPWIAGRSAATVPATERAGMATDLALFIGQMHVPAPPNAPRNPVRGVPLMDRDTAVRERIGVVAQAAELHLLWSRLRDTAPWAGPPVWLHGDLHPANLLIRGGRLSGIVDFGDLTAGDPATDLAVAWLAFDANGREKFWSGLPVRYRSDAALRDRAHGWALVMATALAAHSDDNPGMAALGAHAIGEVLLEA
jgi:aminoglycoside phosphotransferase (APT) family kinase protein